jgi:hypothetical protein
MFLRGLRRQARMRAIDELLPRYRERMRYRDIADGAARQSRRPVGARSWRGDETEWAEEGTDAPLGRADMRAATRALLVSLEEEMRREAVIDRSPRPACRRARLRAAGRAKTERRRRHRAGPPSARTSS